MMKKHAWTPLLVAGLVLLSACGSRSESSVSGVTTDAYPGAARSGVPLEYADEADDYDYLAEPEAEIAYEDPQSGGGETALHNVAQQNRKIVYTYDLTLQTTEFDTAVQRVQEMAESSGGFVEQSYVEGSSLYDRYYSRNASFTLRVPAEGLTSFVSSLSQQFHVVSERKSSSEITAQYYDTQARLESLRSQEERLKAMREGATELEYMLELERELASVLYQIESIVSSINRMDSMVSLSTVNVYLQEVAEYEEISPVQPITFGTRVNDAFVDSWHGFVTFCQSMVLFLIALLRFLPLLVILSIVIWLLIRRHRRRAADDDSPPSPRAKVYPLVSAKDALSGKRKGTEPPDTIEGPEKED